MKRLIILVAVIAVLGVSGCATPVRYGYAYDDRSIPGKNVGVLLGYYGVPSLLITEVDGREFKMTFSQPHPVKIFVLPGERFVKARYTAGHSLGVGTIDTHYADGTLRVNVEAGHTYKILAKPDERKVQFYVQDMGKDYQE